MKMAMHQFTDKSDAFIITAPTYKILNQSTLPAFLKHMEGFGEYKKQDACFKMYNGGTCYMRTATEPDSIVGITNVRRIWGDEAGKYPLYFWENLTGRASFKNCPIVLTTSPYSMNWLYKDIIKPYKENKLKDTLLIQASSIENPYFPKDVYYKNKELMDPRRFNMMFNGNFDRMHGLVYDAFDEKENQIQAFELPPGTKYYGGIDWGFTEPFCLKIRAITPDGAHYGVSEYYKSGLTITDIIAIAKQKKDLFGIQTFYCGHDQPGYIEEFNRNGLSALKADNDVRRGVDLHHELIKTRRLKYFIGKNQNTLDEIEMYHYPEPDDLGPDDDAKDQNPVGQFDHALDADRYLTIMTYRTGIKLVPKLPQEIKAKITQQKRIEMLKKNPRMNKAEDWSE